MLTLRMDPCRSGCMSEDSSCLAQRPSFMVSDMGDCIPSAGAFMGPHGQMALLAGSITAQGCENFPSKQ